MAENMERNPGLDGEAAPPKEEARPALPSINLPKGGGAIRGIAEKFTANPATGTGSLSVPISTSPGRSGFGPQLHLSYDSGAGNGPFGLGWSLSSPAITRKTDKGLPRYADFEDSDVFILSGAEDLVPMLVESGGGWQPEVLPPRTVAGEIYQVRRYRPRIEGLFSRIERWTRVRDGDIHWRSITRDNVTTIYGSDADSRLADPADPRRVFSWLVCQSWDDKGNAAVYAYKAEDSQRIFEDAEDAGGAPVSWARERNRTETNRSANRYLKTIRYGNRTPNRDLATWQATDPRLLSDGDWMFEVVFDYGEGHYSEDAPDADGRIFAHAQIAPPPGPAWPVRQDPFSAYRAGFEVRTYRLCRRVLMFHHFPDELGAADTLVRSTELAYAEGPVASYLTSITHAGLVRQANGGDLNRYLVRTLPAAAFTYSRAPSAEDLAQRPIRIVDPVSLENLPAGLDGSTYQWVDLDGEGSSGILTEQAHAWIYKRNLSASNLVVEDGEERTLARFGPAEIVASVPAGGLGGAQLLDLSGDGQVDLVRMEGPVRGFHERTGEPGWEPFRAFRSWPGLDTRDPNVRFTDLTGDGFADLLVTEGDVLAWSPSLAEEGFGPTVRLTVPLEEEEGARLAFADGTQSVFLADLSGDGLSDLVRIRSSEICYWPNLGYGRFGPKVTMDGAPCLDRPEQFDPRRIVLADTDGSGTTDIVYLGQDGARVYLNQSGNGWSDPVPLPQFPPFDGVASVKALDLLGNGTACLVWSSPCPGHVPEPMRYLALMDEKPHLLVGTSDNLGVETQIHYSPSTRFYLEDEAAGRPWIMHLPFPVHVVDRVETFDRVSRNRFVTRHAYHHGYYDGPEREFRGFGMVEQWDTEELAALTQSAAFPMGDNIDAASHVPPVYTRTWFHTGLYLGREHVSDYFAGLLGQGVGEYYREPGLTDAQARALLLDDTDLPEGLSVDEEREACRALKGLQLRQEVYALDGTDRAPHPYVVTEQSFLIDRLQPRGGNPHAVFFTHARETIRYRYEREPSDPRIHHTLTLEVDDFGNVLKEATAGYGRRQPDLTLPLPSDQDQQTRTLVSYTENLLTNAIAGEFPDDYRAPMAAETRTWELTGYAPTGPAGRFQASDLVHPDPSDATRLALLFDGELPYEASPSSGRQRRLLEQARTLYRSDDLSGLLGLGVLQPLGLRGESYKLAFTPGLLAQVYQRPHQGQPAENLLPAPAAVLGTQGPSGGGDLLSQDLRAAGLFPGTDPDDHWWIPAGRVFYSPGKSDSPAQELTHARRHFFLALRARDPFHSTTFDTEVSVAYDTHDLLVLEMRDALGNRTTTGERLTNGDLDPSKPGNDYRVLQPCLVMDPNRNRTASAFDALGLLVGMASMGKPPPAAAEGDTLDGFDADLTDETILAHMADPLAAPQAILQRATTRLVYDLFAYQRSKGQPAPQPAVVYTLARETHDSDPVPPGGLRIQHAFSYSCGLGLELQRKAQAEPGPAPQRDSGGNPILGPDGQPVMTAGDVNPRWVANGWTVFDNKGKPVRKYEPFFSDTHQFEFGVRVGVSPVVFYDPVGRVMATLHPNQTYEKVVFGAWEQLTYDVNDTVAPRGGETGDPRTDPDIEGYVSRYFALQPPGWQTWYAQRQGGALGPQEQSAAAKAAVHADTPTTVQFDTLGRPFLTLARNRFQLGGPPVEESTTRRVELDVQGRQRLLRDAVVQDADPAGRIVMRYEYDLLGNRIHQTSMEAGPRWMLSDAAGRPLYAWDGRDHRLRTVYDAARRPTDTFLVEGSAAEVLVGRQVYGETQANPEDQNLRGKVFQVLDQAGTVTNASYDFKGNALGSQRQLAQSYDATLDWSAAVPLETRLFVTATQYDALSRPVQVTAPDGSLLRPGYNEAKLLERLDVDLRGAQQNGQPVWTPFVTNLDYDAKGQRKRIDYGNGASTTYGYDPFTFRLTRLVTRRDVATFPDDCPHPPLAGWPGCGVQDLSYTYDPAGNIVQIADQAQQTVFFRNKRVEPSNDYTYDALYRLVEARGREHLGQVGGSPIPHSYDDVGRVGLAHPNDGNALGTYVEQYVHDAAGNILEMIHTGSDPANPGWTRLFTYGEPSALEPAKQSNRLTSTSVGAATAVYSTAGDGYDGHGNLLRMPQLQAVQWDFKDQLRMSQRQSVDGSDASGLQHQGERTWYVYDSGGQRVRKVTELAGKRVDQRITLAGFEVYEREGGSPLTRETLHVMDDRRRIALVETRTDGGASEQLVRFQLGNHLGSACLELDDQAQVITYEEYTPYGSSSYQGVRGQTVPAKRYRYTGRERDEESGLEYHGTRYYVPWLGRWMSADPIGIADGLDVYLYCKDNPVLLTDGMGTDARVSVDQASSTITYSTTVHVYATAAEIAQFQPAATRATQFYRDASGAVTIDGRVWNVRYDVSFQFHDTAVSPVPLGIQTIYDQLSDPSLEPMLRSAPGLMALYNTGLSSAFASGTAQVPGFRLGDSVLSFNRQVTVGNTFQIVPPMLPIAGMHLFPEPTTRAVIGLNPAQNATEENLFRAVIHEVGHTLGFDERYSPEPGAPHHEGYESDFMTSRDLSRDVTFDPRHRAGSARFGEFVANGRNVNDVALRDISIDSTGHGGFPEEANGIHQSDYDTIQSSLRRDVWTRFRQQLTPPPPPPMLQLFPGPLDRQGTIQILPQYDQHTLPGSVDILRLHFW